MVPLTVNGRAIGYDLDPQTPLLWALRDASNLTGTKYGCGTGECGACVVEIDGEAIKSCQVSLADVEGRFVTTIEALSRDRTHPVQLAFIERQVPQCGFCTPGMIMAIAVLLKKNPSPSRADIDREITNLCRCGCYPRLYDAIALAARTMPEQDGPAAEDSTEPDAPEAVAPSPTDADDAGA